MPDPDPAEVPAIDPDKLPPEVKDALDEAVEGGPLVSRGSFAQYSDEY